MIAMNNLEEFARAVGKDVKVISQRPEPTLTLSGNVLGIVGGNTVSLPLPNNTGHEIHGSGFPEGKIKAEVGTTYVDTNATNGALVWIKKQGDGNTGWQVFWGDTGWRNLATVSTLNIGRKASTVRIRRVNNLVSFMFGGLERDRFGIIRRNGDGFIGQNESKGVKIIMPRGIPDGFRSRNSLVGNIFNDVGLAYGVWYLGGRSDSNYMHFTFNEDIPVDKDIDDIRVSTISYFTEDPWPTTLP